MYLQFDEIFSKNFKIGILQKNSMKITKDEKFVKICLHFYSKTILARSARFSKIDFLVMSQKLPFSQLANMHMIHEPELEFVIRHLFGLFHPRFTHHLLSEMTHSDQSGLNTPQPQD